MKDGGCIWVIGIKAKNKALSNELQKGMIMYPDDENEVEYGCSIICSEDIEIVQPLNENPEFVAEREERRQLGIAAKAMRMMPCLVRFGRRGDSRQRFNNQRQNRRC